MRAPKALFPAHLLALLLVMAGCRAPGGPAVLVLEDYAAGAGPSRLKDRTGAPKRGEVRVRAPDRVFSADLYRPAERPRAGIVLVPGLAQQGRRDPRLVRLARTLARVRFLVLVPDLPGLTALEVRARNVDDVASAFRALAGRAPAGARDRLGIAAFSYAAGPALLAALEPGVRDRVGLVVTVGAYYDLPEVIAYLTTGEPPGAGDRRRRGPPPWGKWAFLLGNAELVPDAHDARQLQRLARRRLADPGAPVGDVVGLLGPQGQAVYRLVANREPARVPVLLKDLPDPLRRELAALNLAGKDLSALKARVILLHGPSDPLIPFAQSAALARALPAGQVRLFRVRGLAHVDVAPGRLDRQAMLRAIEAVLDWRGD